MKTFRMFGMALVAAVIAFAFSACEKDGKDDYKDYPQLIVGQWFNFSPTSSVFINYDANGNMSLVGWEKEWGWLNLEGTYSVDGNTIIEKHIVQEVETHPDQEEEIIRTIELDNDKLTFKTLSIRPDYAGKVHYRVQNSFDIKGNYSYLNALARVVPAEGKTALQLPEGLLFNGENTIPVESLNGERIIDASKAFFADATFAEDGKLNHTMNGEVKVKNYTLNGNNLVFNLYEGSDVYKINATSFPDEDGDRLFIIMPKQAAWIGGFVSIIEEQNEGKKFSEAQIAELEKEFMATFETFTVILSLSKK